MTVVCGRRRKVNLVVRCSEWMEVPPPLEGGGWCGEKKRDYKRTIDHVAASPPPPHLDLAWTFTCSIGRWAHRGTSVWLKAASVLLWRRNNCDATVEVLFLSEPFPRSQYFMQYFDQEPSQYIWTNKWKLNKKNIWLLIERIKMLLDRSEFLIWQRRLEAS